MGPNAELNIASAAILVLVFIYATLGYRARQTRRYRLFAALSSATCLAVVAGLARSIIVSCLGEGADAATAPLRAASASSSPRSPARSPSSRPPPRSRRAR